jgi:AcrR family transcriptional regulator
MSPRPRTTSDAVILDALARVVSRIGPAKLTLADVAVEAGHSPAGLVQRFGSKRGLLLAFARREAAEVPARFAAAREDAPSPLEALFDALAAPSGNGDTPQALSNHLALAQMELDDPDFHRCAFDAARAMLDEIRASLGAAVASGELMACDTEGIARTVQTAYTGALATWTVYRQGSLAEWMRGEIEAVLESCLPPLPEDSPPLA